MSRNVTIKDLKDFKKLYDKELDSRYSNSNEENQQSNNEEQSSTISDPNEIVLGEAIRNEYVSPYLEGWYLKVWELPRYFSAGQATKVKWTTNGEEHTCYKINSFYHEMVGKTYNNKAIVPNPIFYLDRIDFINQSGYTSYYNIRLIAVVGEYAFEVLGSFNVTEPETVPENEPEEPLQQVEWGSMHVYGDEVDEFTLPNGCDYVFDFGTSVTTYQAFIQQEWNKIANAPVGVQAVWQALDLNQPEPEEQPLS